MGSSKRDSNDRGNLERLGESAGAVAGRAADWGMEMSGALFQSAGEMLGGWWSSGARNAATGWSDAAERSCRSHYEASAGVATGEVGAATQATHVAPKSQHAAMQSAGEMRTDTSGSALAAESAGDGFAQARPGYQLGYVARRNPDYRGRSFTDVEPELRRVWESRAKTEGSPSESGSSWPEVRGFVDFAYQQADDR